MLDSAWDLVSLQSISCKSGRIDFLYMERTDMKRTIRIAGLCDPKGEAAILLASERSYARIPIVVYLGDPLEADRMTVIASTYYFSVSKHHRLTSNSPRFDNEQSEPFTYRCQPHRYCGAHSGELES